MKFPMHIVQRQGGYPIFDLTVSDVKVNEPVTIQPPQARAARRRRPRQRRRPPADPRSSLTVCISSRAGTRRSRWISRTTSRSSSAGRARRGRTRYRRSQAAHPEQADRYVINTHSHVDHSSGLRAFVAEGATILTHEVNKAYLEKDLSLPHTLGPGRGSRRRRRKCSSRGWATRKC